MEVNCNCRFFVVEGCSLQEATPWFLNFCRVISRGHVAARKGDRWKECMKLSREAERGVFQEAAERRKVEVVIPQNCGRRLLLCTVATTSRKGPVCEVSFGVRQPLFSEANSQVVN